MVRYARFSTISAQKQATHTTNTGSTVSATSVLCKYEVVALGVERKRVDVDIGMGLAYQKQHRKSVDQFNGSQRSHRS